MLKILTQISRVLIGLTFVYSGFVKMVDPMGTKIKMLEYFAVRFFDLEWFNLEFLAPVVLPISILLILAEFVLGIMILVGYKPKFTVWSIFGLTLIFLFLTWYSHAYQVVTDCGCFGDAIKLTTGETFYKNVINIVLIGIMIVGLRYIKPLLSNKLPSLLTYAGVLFSGILMYYALQHLPPIDYRAYKIGTDIKKDMTEIKEGEDFPDIVDFMIDTPEGDQIETVLNAEKSMLVMMNSFDKADRESFPVIAKLAKEAEAKGYLVYIMTDVPEEYLPEKPVDLGLPFKFATCDGKSMKTAIRANPGVMTVEKGIIVGKWNWTDADDVELK